jgi:hypothetical protein
MAVDDDFAGKPAANPASPFEEGQGAPVEAPQPQLCYIGRLLPRHCDRASQWTSSEDPHRGVARRRTVRRALGRGRRTVRATRPRAGPARLARGLLPNGRLLALRRYGLLGGAAPRRSGRLGGQLGFRSQPVLQGASRGSALALPDGIGEPRHRCGRHAGLLTHGFPRMDSRRGITVWHRSPAAAIGRMTPGGMLRAPCFEDAHGPGQIRSRTEDRVLHPSGKPTPRPLSNVEKGGVFALMSRRGARPGPRAFLRASRG